MNGACRHEKVQENCIDLVGRIADRGAEFVPAREWMRICFELLEMLKAHKKGIRRATVNTFGYIAKAIGPQDVLVTLLNNLKVQERQNRVCTTVAIAIVAETCSPFTVLPALMNEYKVRHEYELSLHWTFCLICHGIWHPLQLALPADTTWGQQEGGQLIIMRHAKLCLPAVFAFCSMHASPSWL